MMLRCVAYVQQKIRPNQDKPGIHKMYESQKIVLFVVLMKRDHFKIKLLRNSFVVERYIVLSTKKIHLSPFKKSNCLMFDP